MQRSSQLAKCVSGANAGKLKWRHNAGGWTPWRDMWTSGDGQLVTESGSNPNGSWVMFGDGTMIMNGRKTLSPCSTDAGSNIFGSTSGQSYYNGESDMVLLPTTFLNIDSFIVAGQGVIQYNASDVTAGNPVRVYAVTGNSGLVHAVSWAAIGR